MRKLLPLLTLLLAVPVAFGQAQPNTSNCQSIIGSGGPAPAGKSLICVSWQQTGANPTVVTDPNNVQTAGPIIEFLGRCIGGPNGCSSATQQQSLGPFLGGAAYTALCTPASVGAPVPNCTAANVQAALVTYLSGGQNLTAWAWVALSMTNSLGLYIDQISTGSLVTYAAYASWPGGPLSPSSAFFTFTANTPNPTVGVAPTPTSMLSVVIPTGTPSIPPVVP